ncbi:amino acid permease [Thalassotalea aquiviva]|uniref:amino acid permease n=1 Tax=Thalassotalea aquiviva TaxID=3242415 RepID=UPI00352A8773
MTTKKAPLGLWTATSLVTGNMVGSGIFLLPAALGVFGGISLLGWIFTTLGAMTLAYVFANLARHINGSGGPFIYTQQAFGDFWGFMVAWGYWFCIVSANAAIAIALVSYLTVFVPILAENNLYAAITTLAIIWFLVWVNLRGVKEAGQLQLVTTLVKVLPLLVIAIVGLFYINPDHFSPFNLSQESNLSAISATAAITMWAFLGLESANIPANEIRDPKKNVPRAAILGTLIAAMIYIPVTIAVMGLIEPAELAQSNAPFAQAAAILFGSWAYYFIAAIAVISCFGALNGWTLCLGQVSLAPAKQGLFLQSFAKTSKRGVPAKAIVYSTVLVSLIVLMNFHRSLVEQFTFVILLSTLTSLLPYLVCTIVNLWLIKHKRNNLSHIKGHIALSCIACGFSLWIIINTGFEAIAWGLVLLLCGIPLYFYLQGQLLKRQEGDPLVKSLGQTEQDQA